MTASAWCSAQAAFLTWHRSGLGCSLTERHKIWPCRQERQQHLHALLGTENLQSHVLAQLSFCPPLFPARHPNFAITACLAAARMLLRWQEGVQVLDGDSVSIVWHKLVYHWQYNFDREMFGC